MAAAPSRMLQMARAAAGVAPELCVGAAAIAALAGVAWGIGTQEGAGGVIAGSQGLVALLAAAGLGSMVWRRRCRAREQAERLERQVAERTGALEAVVLGAATQVGDQFFNNLVEHLARALGARYVCVGEILPDQPDRMRAFAVWDNRLSDPIEYNLPGTPCADVIECDSNLYISGDLEQRYPEDPWLAPLDVASYCGAPIHNREGRIVGIVSVLHGGRFASEAMANSLVSLFAQRAGAEMERTGMIAQLTDSKERLSRSEQMLQIAGRVARVGGWELDVESMRLTWTDEVYRICEIDPAAAPDLRAGIEMFVPESRPLIEQAIDTALTTGAGWDLEAPIVTGAGARRWIRSIGQAEMRDGTVTRLSGSLQDINDRKLAELECDQLFEHSLGLICTADLQGRFTRVNPAWTRVLEYTREELMSRPYLDFVHPDDRAATIAATRALARGEPVLDFENRYLTRSGEVRHILWSAVSDLTLDSIYAFAYDVTEKHRADEELRTRETRLRLAVEAAGEGMWDWDLTTGETYYSDSWYTMLGFTPGELEMNIASWEQLCHPDDINAAWTALDRYLRGETPRYISEQRLRTKSGAWKWILDVGEVVERTAAGTAVRAVGVHIDIDQQKRAQAQLDRARAAAEAASQAKSEFLANMSHEIRTPMTAILGYADLLAAPDQTPEQRADAATIIRRNGEHLLRTLSDILDVSRIEAGMLRIDQIEVSPLRIIEDVCHLLEPAATAKGLALKRQWRAPLPQTMQSDPGRLRQILNNLIGNAVKFTEQGVITITTSMTSGALRIDIEDTGIGIDPEQLESLFEPFSQADPSVTRRFGGAGLGLTISRDLARMLGGDITARSAAGSAGGWGSGGSVFTLTLPAPDSKPTLTTEADIQRVARPAPAPSTTTRDPAGALPRLRGRILIAEDGADNQRLIGHHLRTAGAEIVVASNGRLALDAVFAASEPFDLILMDMQMPVMDGYTASAELRQRGYTAPVVALTAHAMPGDRERCIDAGCDDYLSKPIDRATLLATCQQWIKAGQAAV